MKYNCLVVDDNLIERKIIAQYLGKLTVFYLIDQCSDGIEAAHVLENKLIDIVFCDIDMPNISGIDLFKSLKNPPVFIFITSHSEYAVESFDLGLIDFILKPFSFERFSKAANKAVEYIEFKKLVLSKQAAGQISAQIPENSLNGLNDDYFFIRETDGVTKVHCSDVLYIESMGDFSKIYKVQNGRHLTLVSLKNLEKQLPVSIFRRVHKQYIANIDHIITITSKAILMSNGENVPLGPVYRQEIMENFINKKVINRFAE
jgi:two-component system LytT family response regulator